MKENVTWGIGTVLLVHGLRLLIGLGMARFLLLEGVAGTWLLEAADRLLVIVLVGWAVKNSGGSLRMLGWPGLKLKAAVGWGVGGGLLLLAVSLGSERLSATLFLPPPGTVHPLVALAQQASGWRGVAVPLVLAGGLAPLAEELLYRCLTFWPLQQRYGTWEAALVSGIIFALLHFNVYWLGEMLLVSLGLTFIYLASGSLLSAMLAHAVLNSVKLLLAVLI